MRSPRKCSRGVASSAATKTAAGYVPLRWEGTGDQWWYASPVDLAAASGHYDLVRALLRLDANNLIRLCSLRRIRRLESVWDDDARHDAAVCRSLVARRLLHDCDARRGRGALVRAGYGGWLLYTAASAADIGFVRELLAWDPLLVFGEGEYGVTDILYGAARGRSLEVFMVLYDHAVTARRGGDGDDVQSSSTPPGFRWEMKNRAVHAAARGGSWEILKELLGDCFDDVLAYRDVHASTVLHAASGRGQVEVVKGLVGSYDIVTCNDSRGNTSLHVAAYRGHALVVEALILADPTSISLTNNAGDTFLHMAVIGFRSPGFRRIDGQFELMNKLVCGHSVYLQHIINARNNDGRTALHIAVLGNIQTNLVELLMSIPSIDLNIRDIEGMTALDILSRRPKSASLSILIKQLISAGGMSYTQDYLTRSAIVTHLRMQGIGCSPGTSFRIPDSEIFLHSGIENVPDINYERRRSRRPSSFSSTSKSEESQADNNKVCHDMSGVKKPSPINNAKRRFKLLLGLTQYRKKKVDQKSVDPVVKLAERETPERLSNFSGKPTSLRERFSKPSSLSNNKRTLSVRSTEPSPTAKKKFAAGLVHGVIQSIPQLSCSSHHTPSCSFSRSPLSPLSSPPSEPEKQKGTMLTGEQSKPPGHERSSSDMCKLVNQYFCFGGQGLSLDNVDGRQSFSRAYEQSVLVMV